MSHAHNNGSELINRVIIIIMSQVVVAATMHVELLYLILRLQKSEHDVPPTSGLPYQNRKSPALSLHAVSIRSYGITSKRPAVGRRRAGQKPAAGLVRNRARDDIYGHCTRATCGVCVVHATQAGGQCVCLCVVFEQKRKILNVWIFVAFDFVWL